VNKTTKVSRKKLARRDRQQRDKERASLVAEANAENDLLIGQPQRYEQQGLDVRLECVRGSELSALDLAFCVQLLRDNMRDLCQEDEAGWGLSSKPKRRELSDSNSWVLMLRTTADSKAGEACSEAPSEEEEDWVFVEHPLAESAAARPPPPTERNVGFVHLQFCIEAERPVLYVLELQLVAEARGKGLCKFVMQLTERLARKFGMSSLMLTVFKSNARALGFYRDELRYVVDKQSPSRCDRRDEGYEILSKSTEGSAQAGDEAVSAPAC